LGILNSGGGDVGGENEMGDENAGG